uniref:Uncharacterized protein n=1 Tax=Candidatus Kentrum sp. MB TaxID=2138164 RepID=A0A450XPV3_9GAMM|nr:MAG: hypothetical protein BECKMB1821G_GA0114241_102438 [Candidatus Kentron sp. MB]VFK31229.1 MAG: hypothetical protein BECKMB1821I_GA0114274_102137 [Candidatus Kentron sp. MB]VFK75404.1 MAG: hypothetical protein BECKMB1821H_GA0114242_102138 [Candidatus Kentron sp. MB]
MPAVKKKVRDTISGLPDDTDLDEIMYRLYVLGRLHKGQEAIRRREIISGKALERELPS